MRNGVKIMGNRATKGVNRVKLVKNKIKIRRNGEKWYKDGGKQG